MKKKQTNKQKNKKNTHLQGLYACLWMHQPMGKISKYCLKVVKCKCEN